MSQSLSQRMQHILFDDWENRPVEVRLSEAKKKLDPLTEISDDEAEILYGWKNFEEYFLNEKDLNSALEFYKWLAEKFPKKLIFSVALADIFYQQKNADKAAKILLDVYEKDPSKIHKAPAELNELLHSNSDQSVRIKYWTAVLKDIEKSENVKAARKEYNQELKQRLSKEDWLALWKYLMDKGLKRFIKPLHQPEYLIIYDSMWERIIESYFIRKKGLAEEDEPDDTLNGPLEEETVQDFIVFARKNRYPEENRFLIRTVNADSMESVKFDIKWILE